MASFEQHLNSAVIATGIAIVPFVASHTITPTEAMIVLSAGLVGGILPDLDSDNSKPITITFKIISIFLPLLVLLSFSQKLSVFNMLGIWGVSSLVLHFGIFKILTSLTTHRGIFHSIPMGILFAQITILIFYNIFHFNTQLSTIIGSFLFFGYIIHLLLDELVSLNLLGITIKRSFGTALKLYDSKNKLGSIILYIIITALLFIIPIDIDTLKNIIETLKNIKLI